MKKHQHNEVQRFYESLVNESDHKIPNNDARIIFDSIQAAFTTNWARKPRVCPPKAIRLMAYLASCTFVGLNYDKDEQIPWDSDVHDSIFHVVLYEFFILIRDALQNNIEVAFDSRGVVFGCFTIPSWMVKEYSVIEHVA